MSIRLLAHWPQSRQWLVVLDVVAAVAPDAGADVGIADNAVDGVLTPDTLGG